MASDFVVVDVDVFEDGLIELAPYVVVGIEIELVGIFQKLEADFDECGALSKLAEATLSLGVNSIALALDVSDALSDLGLGELPISGKVKQIFFLNCEFFQFGVELLLEETLAALGVGEGLVHGVAHLSDKFRIEMHRSVVLGDRFFDSLHVGKWSIATAVLDAAAEEVEVFALVPPDGSLDDHASRWPPVCVAFAAEQGAFEVVVVDSAPFAGDTAGVEDFLDFVKRGLVDQGLVAARIFLAFVDNMTQVVAVFEQTEHALR